MIVVVGVAGAFMILRDRRRRASNLVAPPISVTLLKVAVMAIAGIVVVLIGNTDRGVGVTSSRGVPWVVLIVLGVLVIYTVLTGGPGSGGISMRSAATRRRPGGPVSTWPGSGRWRSASVA